MDFDNYQDIRKIQQYVANMQPVFSKRSLFSDETENYRIPSEPDPGDTVTIRFRTRKNNVDAVFLISGSYRQEMKLADSSNGFDYYSIDIEIGEEDFHYYFEIVSGRVKCYYNKLGVTKHLQEHNQFGIVPGFSTPRWAKGAVMYQIFVDRFYNGDSSNDVVTGEYFYIDGKSQKIEDWDTPPAAMDVKNFYGGDLQGILDKLDYLQDLGVEVLYLNPIFVSPSNHKYDCQDYDFIDPHYGKIVIDGEEVLSEDNHENISAAKYIKRVTDKENLKASNDFFIKFVNEVHRRGMKVILDGVFNHCGSFNKWMDRERIYEKTGEYENGAFIDENSPYRSFFKFFNEHSWPYNEFYEGWWGHDTLPKLNYEDSPKLHEYIMEIARKWVSPPYNVDGWRLDVAADLGHSDEYNHQFWRDFRKNVKEANPDAIILAEHYGDAGSWLKGDQWDTIMNYDAFMEPITWFLTGMEKHSDAYNEGLYGNSEAFINTMTYHVANYSAPTLEVSMNELSNHDHSRFLTRTNHMVGRAEHLGSEAAERGVDKAVLREAVVMQMTWPGAPTIYYGDEAGLCGFTDPDSRRTYPWGKEDEELIQFHKEMIQIHKMYPELISGSFKYLANAYQQITYGRFTNTHKTIISINNGNETADIEIPIWELGISRIAAAVFERVMLTTGDGHTTKREQYEAAGGILSISLPPKGAIVLRKIEAD